MLDDAPSFSVPIDIISLYNVDDVPIVIPSFISLDGELDIAFMFFSCFKLGRNPCPSALVPNGQSQKIVHQLGAMSYVHYTTF